MPKRNGIELVNRNGDSLVEDPCRCLALWLIRDALESIASPRVARWFEPGNSNFPFWCRVAEVSPTAVRAEARRRRVEVLHGREKREL